MQKHQEALQREGASLQRLAWLPLEVQPLEPHLSVGPFIDAGVRKQELTLLTVLCLQIPTKL